MPRDGQQTRTAILDAAERLILARGFAGAGVDRIIADAGTTKGGFFHHFDSKAALAQALIQRWSQADLAHLEGKLTRAERLVDDPLQQLLAFLGFFIEETEEDSTLPGCLYAAYSYQTELFDPGVLTVLAEGMLTWRHRLRGKLEEVAATHPPVSEVDLDAVADAVTVVFEGAFVVSRSLGDGEVLRQQLVLHRTMLRALFAGSA